MVAPMVEHGRVHESGHDYRESAHDCRESALDCRESARGDWESSLYQHYEVKRTNRERKKYEWTNSR